MAKNGNYRISTYTVTDDNGNEFDCDAVIVNDAGAWAATAASAVANEFDHVTFDGSDYIEAPENWPNLVLE